MGFLSDLLGFAAPVVGGLVGGPVGSAIGGAVGGALSSKSGSTPSGTQTVTQQQQLDPRIASMLFGDGAGNQGLLAQYQSLGQQPQSAGSAAIGNTAQGWLQNSGNDILKNLYGGANTLLGSNISAPQAQASMAQAAQGTAAQGQAALGQAATGQATLGTAAQGQAALGGPAAQSAAVTPQFVPGAQTSWNTGESVSAPQNMQAATIAAPSQNNLNLSGSFDRFINGDAGANPYLTKALQSGVDMTNTSYQRNLGDLTDTLQRSVLPGIRSNSVLAGQYGGSRQGIAEGKALSDFTKQATSANLQLGQANSANTTGAQAQAFNQGQDRALQATLGLSGQQYGAAAQNAGFQQQANMNNYAGQQAANSQTSSQLQQANLANQAANQSTQQFNSGLIAQVGRDNAQLAQNNNQFNAGLQQQSNLTNLGNQQQFNLANLGNQQQTNLANMGAQNQFGLSNLGNQQQTNMQNLGNQQQTGMQNLSNQQQTGMQNLGNQQQTNLANQGAQNQTSLANLQALLGTNSLNSANQATGLQGMSGLLNQIYGFGQNQDNYALNRAQQTNNLIAPYLSANSSSNTQSPIYSNTGGNILGGAAAGLGLYNQFANLGGGNSSNTGYNMTNLSPGTAPVNTGALQNLDWLNTIGR
jgi:hypothetical protein